MKRKTMSVKQPRLRATAKLGEQVARIMAASEAAISRGDVPNPDAPEFENDIPPAWVSKLATDAAKGLPVPKAPKTFPKPDWTLGRLAVLPLLRKTSSWGGRMEVFDLSSKAKEIASILKEAGIDAIVVEDGPIGRRYKEQDEAGTRACLTVDSGTIKNQTVTVREYGKIKQYRAKVKSVIKKFKPEIRVGRKHGRVFITKGGKPYGAQG